jgi:hypothetical protein
MPADYPKGNTSQRVVLHQQDRTKESFYPYPSQASQPANDLLQPKDSYAGMLPEAILLEVK